MTLADKIKEAFYAFESFPVQNKEALEQFRIKYLGSKGLLSSLFEEFKSVPPEEKKETGKNLNQLKADIQGKYSEYSKKLEDATGDESDIDLTLPAGGGNLGQRHPVSIVWNRITDIFCRIGYSIAEGPEIETGRYNFTALNFPENHPAMCMQDTFYIKKNDTSGDEEDIPASVLLRTHTSSVQIRIMEKTPPPIKVICPGRVYRNETITARAHCFFHQAEGLFVDEGVSFADLKQTLFYFAREMFGQDVKVRFRPSYFPFTEPSAEMDISCIICNGKGCPVCKQSGWVEILGCGMVHPAVLENCKIDSEKYTGFAFGMGIERIAMLCYRINDIRILFENDMRFLMQFKGAL